MIVLGSDVVDHAKAALADAAFESAVFVAELFRSDAAELLTAALGHAIVQRESPPGALCREVWLIDTDTGSGIRMSAGPAVGVRRDVRVAEHIAPGDQPGLFERMVAAIPPGISAHR